MNDHVCGTGVPGKTWSRVVMQEEHLEAPVATHSFLLCERVLQHPLGSQGEEHIYKCHKEAFLRDWQSRE